MCRLLRLVPRTVGADLCTLILARCDAHPEAGGAVVDCCASARAEGPHGLRSIYMASNDGHCELVGGCYEVEGSSNFLNDAELSPEFSSVVSGHSMAVAEPCRVVVRHVVGAA